MKNIFHILEEQIYPMLPEKIIGLLRLMPFNLINHLTEIRLRINQPLMLAVGNDDIMIDCKGEITTNLCEAYRCSKDEIQMTLQLISKNSLYAFEKELQSGFITIKGGHRVGLSGQALLNGSSLRSMTNISSMNFRVAREVIGSANNIIPYLIDDDQIYNTLIISPPKCGKTTILRDILRQLSTGVPSKNCKGVCIGLVDERSEIAACDKGVPTVDLGPRIDVLDGCPKAEGMLMLIRSMSPRIVAADELGRAEDVLAVMEAINAGVSVITTVHGRNLQELELRPHVGDLIKNRCFDRYVILTNRPQIGTVHAVYNAKNNKMLFFHNLTNKNTGNLEKRL